jgi:hypothetical protein
MLGKLRGQATLPNLEIGRGAARVLSSMLGKLRGQATLPNLEIGNGACGVSSCPYPTSNLIHRCFINLLLRKAKFFWSLERMIATFD